MKFNIKFELKPRHRKLLAIVKVYWPTCYWQASV
jgi:hypothetical protein